MRSVLRTGLLGATLLVACAQIGGGCASPVEESSRALSLGVEGAYVPPVHVLEAGDQFNIDYVGAGSWIDEETSCAGDFTDGAQELQQYLLQYFPQTYFIGGYSCRPIVGNPTQTSVHSIGRALDIMIYPLPDGEADNDLGDPLANWLIKNAEHIGIQFVIWDKTSWGPHRTPGDRARPYTGGSPHTDHLHIELSVDAAARRTAFFQRPQPPPMIEECAALPEVGGIIDEEDSCTQLMGRSQSWRRVPGAGHGDHLVWTNAFESDKPSNWARYQVSPSLPGAYKVEVFTGTEFSTFDRLRYEVHHGQSISEKVIDPRGPEGWRELGTFEFDMGGGQAVALFDNRTPEKVLEHGMVDVDQHIAVDAIRLTPSGFDSSDSPEKPDNPGGPNPGEVPGDLHGGCQSSGGSQSMAWSLAFTVLAFIRRRKQRSY